jgi:Ca2+/Na+ antiporter
VSQASQQIGAAEAAASPPATVGATAAAPGATPTTVPLLSGSASTPAKAAETTMSTPQRLRLLSLGVVVVGLVIGVIGALIFTYLAVSLSRAKADTAQLIRVQKIQSNLLSADATATNAFLVGGLEPPAQRAAYDQAMSSTSSLIAEATQAQRADGTALAALNLQVLGYAAMIEQARANNRQGLPVGAQYLRNASAQLRSEALPVLDNLVSANAARAADEMTVGAGYVVLVLTLLALGGVIAAQIWLARRFKRKINVGMLAGSIVLFVLAVVSLIVVVQLHSALNQISSGSLAAVNTAADARIDANDAKSNESLTLIARGSGQAFEAAWKSSANSVTESVGRLTDKPELVSQWQAYTDVHTQIRALDDGGQWDKAVAKATGSASDSSNTAFGAFDSNLAGYLDSVSQDASDSLAAEQPGMVVAAILFLLGGVAAALLGRRGVTERLREYR